MSDEKIETREITERKFHSANGFVYVLRSTGTGHFLHLTGTKVGESEPAFKLSGTHLRAIYRLLNAAFCGG